MELTIDSVFSMFYRISLGMRTSSQRADGSQAALLLANRAVLQGMLFEERLKLI